MCQNVQHWVLKFQFVSYWGVMCRNVQHWVNAFQMFYIKSSCDEIFCIDCQKLLYWVQTCQNVSYWDPIVSKWLTLNPHCVKMFHSESLARGITQTKFISSLSVRGNYRAAEERAGEHAVGAEGEGWCELISQLHSSESSIWVIFGSGVWVRLNLW